MRQLVGIFGKRASLGHVRMISAAHRAAANSLMCKRGLCVKAQKPFSLGRVNHIAIAVPNLMQAAAFYRDVLGATVSSAERQPAHGVSTVFVKLPNCNLELLEPLAESEHSPLHGFLRKNSAGGLHHVCLEVDDIDAAVDALRDTHHVRTLTSKPAMGAHGDLVIFLHSKDCGGVLLELQQSRN